MSWRGEAGKPRAPTWFLVLLMVAALGVAIWAVARDEIYDFVRPLLG